MFLAPTTHYQKQTYTLIIEIQIQKQTSPISFDVKRQLLLWEYLTTINGEMSVTNKMPYGCKQLPRLRKNHLLKYFLYTIV